VASSFGQPPRRNDGELERAGFKAEEIIGKIPILPRGDPRPLGDDKIDSTRAGSLNVQGKAAWDNHRRRQAETLAFLQSICRAACRTPPAPLTAEAALDQAGQEVGAIMLTRNLTPVRLPLGRLTDDKR